MTASKSTSTKSNKSSAKTATIQAPAQIATPFKGMLQALAKKGQDTAKSAQAGVDKATHQKNVGNIAPVGVATRNAGKLAVIPGLALVGVNGRKQPLASSVTAQIWLAALAHQLANNGAMPTQAHIKLACPTVNPTSCGLGLTQYKAYTGQCKGMPVLTLAQLQAMAQAPAVPTPSKG